MKFFRQKHSWESHVDYVFRRLWGWLRYRWYRLRDHGRFASAFVDGIGPTAGDVDRYIFGPGTDEEIRERKAVCNLKIEADRAKHGSVR